MKKIFISAFTSLIFITSFAQIPDKTPGNTTINNNQNGNQASVAAPGQIAGYKNSIEIFKTQPSPSNLGKDPRKNALYPFTTVEGDALGTRIYKLKNGLTVYLSQNKLEPRIQTCIAVRTGSKNDPKETTGLAHYLEHMLFKGSNNFGTTNYAREKTVLSQIAQLYEQNRREKDPQKKKLIYAKIDSISQQAAKFAIPNEYDKMISSLGAKGDNAYTDIERTVYINDIPSGELEKWLVLQSDRFQQLVLRLFHTELEAVYEEYNMSQDRDSDKMWEQFMQTLFPANTYGTPVIGWGEHLKNPSMNNILAYFSTYYVPNNMAIILSGDLNYDATIQLIDKYFGSFSPRPLNSAKQKPEAPITSIQKRDVYGTEAANLMMGFRLHGANTREALLEELVAGILYNGRAGLIDLNLKQQQKVLDADAWNSVMQDYSILALDATPRNGQSLEDCEKLLVNEINKLKTGDFDESLIQSVVNDMRLQQTKRYETNSGRAFVYVDNYILGSDWKSEVNRLNVMSKFTKKDVMDFASENLKDNYVIVYKREGEDKNVKKIDKPQITPVEANRDTQSLFLKDFLALPSKPTAPEFINYKEKIKTQSLTSGIDFSYIRNELNSRFELYYIFDMGSDNDLYLALAVNFLPYMGTDKYTSEQLKEEFYKYGLNFNVSTLDDQVYISLSGLETNLDKGIELFEHILANVKPDREAYTNYVDDILKKRADAKLDKGTISYMLTNYAQYGKKSSATNILSADELKKTNSGDLANKIKSLTSYKHRIFYYGQKQPDAVIGLINTYHKIPQQLKEYPAANKYPELPTDKTKIYFVNYDMVQAQIIMLSKDEMYNKNLTVPAKAFNEYYGGSMASIVFQDIRETKGLAYYAYAAFSSPYKKDESHYVEAFLATQADKTKESIEAMQNILSDMPVSVELLEQNKAAVKKQIESERITRSSVFWSYENLKRKGLDYDIRKNIYEQIDNVGMEDVQKFFNEHVAGKKYAVLVMGDKNKIDMAYLKSLGEFKEVSLEEIFGY